MPLLWLSLAFLTGILLAERLGGSPLAWLGLGAAALGAEVAWLLVKWLGERVSVFAGFADFLSRISGVFSGWLQAPVPYFVLLLALFLGGARYLYALPQIDPGHVAWYNDTGAPMVLEGVITAPSELRDGSTVLRLDVDQLHPTGELLYTAVSGKLYARIPPGGDFHYGDRVVLEGYLETPHEDEAFSYRDYLARQGIYSVFRCKFEATRAGEECARRLGRGHGNPLLGWIYDLRRRSLELLYQLFPAEEASLLAGILLGIESGITDDMMDAFQATGTAHIIVISGFNFVIVAGFFTDTLGRLLGRWRGMLAAILGIVLYAVFVGGGAVVVRAAVMGGFAVFARQIGRRQNGINSLIFIGALMSLWNPHVLWDVGFQLSFAATLGLVLYADPLTEFFIRRAAQRLPVEAAERLAGPVGDYFLYTLAAQVMVLPVILYHFRRLSLISFIANPLVLPVQPPLMLLGGLALVFGLVLEPLGQLVAYLAWPLVAYTIRVVEWLASAPVTDQMTAEIGLLAVVLFYALLLAATFAGEKVRSWVRRVFDAPSRNAAVALALVGLSAVLVWRLAIESPDGRLHLTMLDTGGGEAFLVQSPQGRYLLINGGPSANRLSADLGRRLPLGHRRLDYLVVSGSTDEQLGSLPETIERFPPGELLWSGTRIGENSIRRLQVRLIELRIPAVDAQPGHVLDLGKGARLEVLATGEQGAVLWLEWGRFRALLPLGMDFDTMDRLQTDPTLAPVTALLLAQNGLASLNTPEWIDHWRPQLLLLSVAAGNIQGLPNKETLQATMGYNLLRTDQNGWVMLSTNGDQLWVETERK